MSFSPISFASDLTGTQHTEPKQYKSLSEANVAILNQSLSHCTHKIEMNFLVILKQRIFSLWNVFLSQDFLSKVTNIRQTFPDQDTPAE